MHVLRRLVWWKCLFWIVAGCGLGAAIAALRPEPGPPVGGTRVSAERLAIALLANDPNVGVASGVVVYPPHRDVQMVTFDYRVDGKTMAGYAFANTPFVTAVQLKNTNDDDAYLARRHLAATATPPPRSLMQRLLGTPAAPAATPAESPADAARPLAGAAALADAEAQPAQRWPTATAFLDHVKTKRPDFGYGQAWWTADAWVYGLPMAAGAALVGTLGSVLTRRSAADLAAADLLARTRVESSAAPTPSQHKDMSEVEALDAVLAARLAGQADDATVMIDPAAPAAPTPAGPVELKGERLVAAAQTEQEKKDYAGEFYPTVRRAQPKAFSLVELLVVIGVIAILIGLLLPTLVGARRSADTVACAANLRGIGQGMSLYLLQNRDTFPPAYLYIGHRIENGVQTPTSPAAGYVHWSSYLYGTGGVGKNAFLCPAMRQGGLPPTNTPPENRDPGQNCPSDTVTDQQAPRLAYSVNEALCPRNKFIAASFGGARTYRFVKATEVANSSGTILGMEMIDNAVAISYGNASQGWIMSHRPISGFVGLTGEVDMYLMPVGSGFRPAAAGDLDADPNTVGDNTHTRLDLVGRNHGKKAGYPDRRLTNFLYCDGHVETKSVYDTVTPAFEWGAKFYSLVPNDDQVNP